MDLLLSSPNPVATNLIGSDFVEVPELNGPAAGKPEIEVDTSPQLLPPPPPLIPAPEHLTMEEVKSDQDVSPALLPCVEFVAETLVPPPPPPQESLEEQLNRLLLESKSFRPMGSRTTPTCPQIMTRKRSSMSAGSGNGCNIMALSEPSQVYMEGPVNQVPIAVAAAVIPSSAAPPPKKKKKYTPKPRKTPTPTAAPSLPSDVPLMEGSAPPPPPPPAKPHKPKSAKKKTSPVVGAVAVPGGAPTAAPAKPKKPSKPKAPKKKPSGCGTITTSSKSKSSSKKKANVTPPPNNSFPANQQSGLESVEGGRGLLVPPLKIHMPKLTKMVPSVVKNEVGEGEEWDDNGEPLDPLVLAEAELLDGGAGGKGGRKKKSKGRNGNIYIGVFNRIEWIKLQNEFGFGSVNNFGTFVLQTMRRVHGDIQFWCDVAVGSGIYPDLDHYKWTNGFPHAVNKEAQYFTPEPDVMISEEKREEVIEMAKGMWDQRLQALKQQQQQLNGQEGGVEGEDAVIEEAEVVEVDDEEEDEEEDPLMMPGLENYLENMASGRYSPGGSGVGEIAQLSSSAGQGTFGKSVALTEEEVNKIWNEQVNDADNVEKFGKLFSFINSIAAIGKREDGEGEAVEDAVEGNQGDQAEVQEAIAGVGAN